MLPIIRLLLLLLLLPVAAGAEPFYWGGQMSLSSIKESSAAYTGSTASGIGFYNKYRAAMNATDCSTGSYRACSMSDIRSAMTNHVSGWDTLTYDDCAWVMGAYDPSVASNYGSVSNTTTNCSSWGSIAGYGLAFCGGTANGEFGFMLKACSTARKLLCCN